MSLIPIVLLVVSNVFMTFAWYLREPLKWHYVVGFVLIAGGALFVFAPWEQVAQ